MSDTGVLVGCDKNQEWLLPWWWEHYSKHNSYPVAFADFGMSEKGVAWASERGVCFGVEPIDLFLQKQIPKERRDLWEDHYGEPIWSLRKIWLRKPFAISSSPFPLSIWLDLDCQVRASLDPLFHCLQLGADICLRREWEWVQKTHRRKGFISSQEVNYNCGVIPFRRDAAIIHQWTEEIRERSDQFVFDQQALARALRLQKSALVELPPIYNWSVWNGENSNALIYHFHGEIAKKSKEFRL